ncbi:MAG: META domain-containing protein [Myxococcota bacterium]|nr:META domain-containing protein [Myxococcota bacterium]
MHSFALMIWTFACTEIEPTHSFQGKDFILDSAEGYTPIGDEILLSFSTTTETFVFDAGCNRYDATYTYDNSFFDVISISGTEMSCDTDLMEQDAWFVDFLTYYPTLTHEDDRLILEFIDDNHSTPDIKLIFVEN